MDSFEFNFQTFDSEEFNEIILEVPFTSIEENQNTKAIDDSLMTASMNEMTTIIVAEMMATVKQDFSSINRKKA